MITLLIDLGNSRMKWAQARGEGELFDHGSFTYAAGGEESGHHANLTQMIAELPREASVAVIVSVARPELAEGLASWLREEGATRVVLAKVQRTFAGLTVGYTHIAKLGVDRWAAMLGAARRVGFPCAVVDFGTAMTIDVVDGSGQHLGGAIAPGRTLQRRSLRQSTAQIRAGQREPAPASLFARDTGEAVAAGVDHGLAALVGLAHATLGRQLASDAPHAKPWPPLLVTGGDARDLLPLLPAHAQHVDDLVLEGARSLLEGAEEMQ